MKKIKKCKGEIIPGAKHKQRTLKAIVTVSVIVMLVGTMLFIIPPSESEENWEYEVDEYTVGLWHLNEGTDVTAYDETDNDNNGILQNGVKWTTDARFGSHALEFDGENDYVEVPDSDSLKPIEQFTLEAWFKADAFRTSDKRSIQLINKRTGGSGWRGYSIETSNVEDGILFFNFKNSDGDLCGLSTPEPLSINRWYHVAGTYDGQVAKLFINGIEVNSTSFSGNISHVDLPLRIGYRADGAQPEYFNGIIDEVRISNISRTEFNIPPTLNLKMEKTTYYQDDVVTINSTYSNGIANITFQVKDPDDQTYLVETIETNETGFAQLQFQLYVNDPIGNWTVYATNDKDNAKDNITFEVLGVRHLIIKLLDVPSSVNRGETLNVDFTIENTFDTAKDVTLVLQLKDPNKRALRPDIEDKTIEASSTLKHTLSVDIPSDAKKGTYFLQGQMLTELPENNGYAIDYETTSIKVN